MADEWTVLDEELPVLGANYGRIHARMTALGIGGDEFVVVSPGQPCDPALFEALDRRGTTRWLLAPNHFHNEGLMAWKRRYPEARVVAHARAHARLARKVPELGAIGARAGTPAPSPCPSIEDLDALRAALPASVRFFGPPMATQGETWISVKTRDGALWIVGDAVVNDRKYPWPMRLIGFRPGLMTNPLFKRLFLENKADYKKWMIEQLAQEPPSVLVPCHGAVERGADLAERLRRVTEEA